MNFRKEIEEILREKEVEEIFKKILEYFKKISMEQLNKGTAITFSMYKCTIYIKAKYKDKEEKIYYKTFKSQEESLEILDKIKECLIKEKYKVVPSTEISFYIEILK